MITADTAERIEQLKIILTSDVHGNFFMHDYVNNHAVKGSMARVYAYVQSLRRTWGKRLLLLDAGDMTQGNPIVYYSNYMDRSGRNLPAELMNYMNYDVGVVGNHDIETGHAVYDAWVRGCNFPVLGANVIDVATGKCYFKPYTIIERSGVRLAVLGMTTPAIPNWLPPALWSGLHFQDMVECAGYWMKVIRDTEHPDVVIGLFHSGKEGGIVMPRYAENAALDVARLVPGFDVVCYGHDHMRNCESVVNVEGQDVLCCAPTSLAVAVGEIDLKVSVNGQGHTKVVGKSAHVTDLSFYSAPETRYLQHYFRRFIHNTEYYVNKVIGTFTRTIRSQDAYFGPSAFVDIVHAVQLKASGAEISFASPVSFSAEIKQGDVHVRDVFNLYRYDDVVYTIRLTGREVKDYLEMSYGLWVEQMHSPDDHIMQLDYVLDDGKRLGFRHLAYNFDSAAGIVYEIDVTRPVGQKINIQGMADGKAFSMDATYQVAVNSYRGNGGGELLTKGAGISHECLATRLLRATTIDLRQLIIEYIEQNQELNVQPFTQWKFVPAVVAQPAIERDRKLLFNYYKTE